MRTVRLWVPDDLERVGRPRVIARDGVPPQPGRVFDVEARDRATASLFVARATAPEPDVDQDPEAWLQWRAARKLVKEVTRG